MFDEDMERDRKIEMQQCAYEELKEINKIRLLHEDPETIVEWPEWDEFNQACISFREFCLAYDLDFNKEAELTIEGL